MKIGERVDDNQLFREQWYPEHMHGLPSGGDGKVV